MRKEKENPRRQNGGLLQKKTAPFETGSSLTGCTDFWEAETQRHRLLTRSVPVFTVRITYRPSAARRSTVFFTAQAAKRHATTMTELGHDAEVTLCALTPLEILLGGDDK